MAVVPFRVSGAAADQTLEQRLFQIGPHTIFIKQNPKVCVLADRAPCLFKGRTLLYVSAQPSQAATDRVP